MRHATKLNSILRTETRFRLLLLHVEVKVEVFYKSKYIFCEITASSIALEHKVLGNKSHKIEHVQRWSYKHRLVYAYMASTFDFNVCYYLVFCKK